jgi:hypothetical protein
MDIFLKVSTFLSELSVYVLMVLKGIVQPFELGGETRLIRSAVKK